MFKKIFVQLFLFSVYCFLFFNYSSAQTCGGTITCAKCPVGSVYDSFQNCCADGGNCVEYDDASAACDLQAGSDACNVGDSTCCYPDSACCGNCNSILTGSWYWFGSCDVSGLSPIYQEGDYTVDAYLKGHVYTDTGQLITNTANSSGDCSGLNIVDGLVINADRVTGVKSQSYPEWCGPGYNFRIGDSGCVLEPCYEIWISGLPFGWQWLDISGNLSEDCVYPYMSTKGHGIVAFCKAKDAQNQLHFILRNANITPPPTSTPPPPTSTPTPTPPLSSCNQACLIDDDCKDPFVCVVGMFGGLCRNSVCLEDADCLCPTPTPSPLGCNETCDPANDFCQTPYECRVVGVGGGVFAPLCRLPVCEDDSDCVCNKIVRGRRWVVSSADYSSQQSTNLADILDFGNNSITPVLYYTSPYAAYYYDTVQQTGSITFTAQAEDRYETGHSICYDTDDYETCHVYPKITPGASKTIDLAGFSSYANLDFHYLPYPNCQVSGPEVVPIGETVVYNIASSVPIPSDTSGFLWNFDSATPGWLSSNYQIDNRYSVGIETPDGSIISLGSNTCGNNSTCTGTVTVDPSGLGLTPGDSFTIFCRSQNYGVHECTPENLPLELHPKDISCGGASSVTFNVTVPLWWQAGGGNVVSKSSVSSQIPDATPAFTLIRGGIDDPIGLLIYSYSLDLNGQDVSLSKLSSQASFSTRPSSSFSLYYEKKLPDDVESSMYTISSNTMELSSLISNCTLSRGYKVCYYDGTTIGDFSLTNTANDTIPLDTRLILLIDNADITIKGRIRPLIRGRSSFLLISEGDISVDPAIGYAQLLTGSPDLEGIFHTDGVFHSGHFTDGSKDLNLHIRGAVSANSFDLGRDMKEDNLLYPGEYFMYGPEQVMAFPPFFRLRATSWQEVPP